jgi:wyosine [tRNA(Phe)-imidazoG37] synthetase (radical SAM superfamily)
LRKSLRQQKNYLNASCTDFIELHVNIRLLPKLLQSLAIAASPLQAASLEFSHRFFENWPITSIAEHSTSIVKLRTEGGTYLKPLCSRAQWLAIAASPLRSTATHFPYVV